MVFSFKPNTDSTDRSMKSIGYPGATQAASHRYTLAVALKEVEDIQEFVKNGSTFQCTAELMLSFYFANKISGLRVWLILTQKGFKKHTITVQKAADLTGWSVGQCYRALNELEAYMEERMELIRKLGLGEFFTKSSQLKSKEYMEKSEKNSPRIHKKGHGSGEKEGRKEHEYVIPRQYAFYALFGPENQQHKYDFEEKCLESNKTLKWAIRKTDVAGTSRSIRAKDRAKKWKVSAHTLREGDHETKVSRDLWRMRTHLTMEEYKKLPQTVNELFRMLRHRKHWFSKVWDKNGQSRLACKDEITKEVGRLIRQDGKVEAVELTPMQ